MLRDHNKHSIDERACVPWTFIVLLGQVVKCKLLMYISSTT